MNYKWPSIVSIGFILSLVIILASCDNSPDTKPFPPPEGYSSWTEYEERNDNQSYKQPDKELIIELPQTSDVKIYEINTEPEPQIQETQNLDMIIVPIEYKVVKSWIEEETITHVKSIYIDDIGESEQIEEVPLYVIYITLKNTDNVSGNFKVDFIVAEPLDNLFLNQRHALGPGETITLICPTYALGDWKYIITPSEKTVKQ